MAQREEHQQQVMSILAELKLPKDITLRCWIENDFPIIQNLSANEGWPTAQNRPEESLAAWQNSWPTLVAIETKDVIGFVRAFTDGTITMFVSDLFVASEQRGRGIGHALLDACHLLYPCTRIELISTENAQSFYTSHNFRRVGQGFRKSYV